MFMVSAFLPQCDEELVTVARQYSEHVLIGKTVQIEYTDRRYRLFSSSIKSLSFNCYQHLQQCYVAIYCLRGDLVFT